jgi:hypothetical protein
MQSSSLLQARIKSTISTVLTKRLTEGFALDSTLSTFPNPRKNYLWRYSIHMHTIVPAADAVGTRKKEYQKSSQEPNDF